MKRSLLSILLVSVLGIMSHSSLYSMEAVLLQQNRMFAREIQEIFEGTWESDWFEIFARKMAENARHPQKLAIIVSELSARSHEFTLGTIEQFRNTLLNLREDIRGAESIGLLNSFYLVLRECQARHELQNQRRNKQSPMEEIVFSRHEHARKVPSEKLEKWSNASSMLARALDSYFGNGVQKNIRGAAFLFESLLRQTDNPSALLAAQFYLGKIYFEDQEIRRDLKIALNCFQDVAHQDLNGWIKGQAIYYLGRIALLNGDKLAAGDFFRKAALQKDNTWAREHAIKIVQSIAVGKLSEYEEEGAAAAALEARYLLGEATRAGNYPYLKALHAERTKEVMGNVKQLMMQRRNTMMGHEEE